MAGVVGLRARAGLLTAVTVLPLLLGGGTAAADGSTAGHRPVPLSRLVPGVPLPHGAEVTRDEGYPLRFRHGRFTGLERRLALPSAEQVRTAQLIEYVPPRDAAVVRAHGLGRLRYCSPYTGPYQRRIERFLHLLTRHRQTHGNCAAIRRYQRGHGIRPAIGFAGPVTWGMMRESRRDRAAERKTLTADDEYQNPCPFGQFRIVCVDQTYQQLWVQEGDQVVFGPVPARTGLPGHRTRNGMHRIYWRHLNHYSTIYNSPMPYAQFFSGGQALHGILGSPYGPGGSYGCINLRLRDARDLWNMMQMNDRVYVWGVRPAP